MGRGSAFACPVCGHELEGDGQAELRCPADGRSYGCVDGIWRFIPPERLAGYEQFIEEYETVRRSEGRVSVDDAYYRALPFRDLTGRHADNWRIRAKSFQVLLDRVVKPAEARLGRPLEIVDLGAGNCWLSFQLARRGHACIAVDLLVNDFDGLGCRARYDAPFTAVQAEFDHLPLPDGGADLVVFNASLHYSTGYESALAEALRVLQPGGTVAVVDSPVYHDAASGSQMVREREAQFLKEYGFASNSLPSENYLTDARLDDLAAVLGLKWEKIEPFYGVAWALRPWRARLRGRREPARFMVIAGTRVPVTRAPESETTVSPAGAGSYTRTGSVVSSLCLPVTQSPPLPVTSSPRLRVALWRFVTRLRYLFLARGRYNRLALEDVAGRPILVLPGVFNPKLLRTGEILARALDPSLVPEGSDVLDMGTGSGVGAVFAAALGTRVVAVDVNPEAARCARINAALNRMEDRVEVLEGDLFSPVGERRFDTVLFNPPYYRGEPKDRLDMAWRAPDLIERFAAGLPSHLRPGGHALVVLSSDGEQAAFLAAFRAAGLGVMVALRTDLGNEVVTVYRLTMAEPAQSRPQAAPYPGIEASAGGLGIPAKASIPGIIGGTRDG